MKNNTLKYALVIGFLFFMLACSTNRNTFVSRNSHALSTEYNILYNGGLAYDKGLVELKSTYNDNFWETLPIERIQLDADELMPGQAKNANFELAETKAIKAIQKHSMNIYGSEYNPQMDEAHLLLGKARYYDQRFIPALEAFNYILYKYPSSDKIYEAKIWREKTNIRLDNDALAVNNLKKLLKEIKFKNQIFADANASLAQAFLNLKEKDSAVAKIKLAITFTKLKEEKARYRFILAQIYEEIGYKDSAFVAYQSVIDMKRKAPRQYVIQAHAKQARQFDFKNGDTAVFLRKYRKLLADRENRPYLDVIHHQVGLFFDQEKQTDAAIKQYTKSIKLKSRDNYLVASNYRNLAELYFDKAKYETAGKYYDSTLVQLNPKSKEFKQIKRKRENLVDVIKYEGIATKNDSIIKVLALTTNEREAYYENYIAKLKIADEQKRILEEKEKAKQALLTNNDSDANDMASPNFGTNPTSPVLQMDPPMQKGTSTSDFYFYNSSSVDFGKIQFKKKWGNRAYKKNWRVLLEKPTGAAVEEAIVQEEIIDTKANADTEKVQYQPQFYLDQLPKDQDTINAIVRERDFAYYQLGVIYKEKFSENQLAANKFEQLLVNNPEERLVLPTMYNLYKIYEIIDKERAIAMKNSISTKYPNSRYAQIINNQNPEDAIATDTPEKAYNSIYKEYEKGEYRTVLTHLEEAVTKYQGEELVSKFELLKANTIGKLQGVAEYKKALNFVALNYPNNEEGKTAESILKTTVPVLESVTFNSEPTKSWKIVYKVAYKEEKKIKELLDKINKFIKSDTYGKISVSNDIYTMTENFVVIHGINSAEYARGIVSILKDYKDYKIKETAVVVSNNNYKVIQIKKNWSDFSANVPFNATENAPGINRATPVGAASEQPTKASNTNAAPSEAVNNGLPKTEVKQDLKPNQEKVPAVQGNGLPTFNEDLDQPVRQYQQPAKTEILKKRY